LGGTYLVPAHGATVSGTRVSSRHPRFGSEIAAGIGEYAVGLGERIASSKRPTIVRTFSVLVLVEHL